MSFDVNASDPDENPLGFVIMGGSDELTRNQLHGIPSKRICAGMDFEVPIDADRDNVYLLIIGVSDGIELAIKIFGDRYGRKRSAGKPGCSCGSERDGKPVDRFVRR